ncbi:MAG: bifunctional hydroxymethylpyrimidine kinase/phosphomethylpyrimidine kinase [Acetomicrobium sp.]
MTYRGIAMTIAGSDSGGGAGIEADLATFLHLKVFGTAALAAVTAQNSLGVHKVFDIPCEMVGAQIKAILTDFSVGAVKTGMLSREETISEVAEGIKTHRVTKLVVDPVMVAQSGDPLMFGGAVNAMIGELLPLAFIVTPNIPEAEKLTGMKITSLDEMKEAAKVIAELGPKGVFVKGGHLGVKGLPTFFTMRESFMSSSMKGYIRTIIMEQVVHCRRRLRRNWLQVPIL